MHGLAFYPFELTRRLWACVPWFPFFVSLSDSALFSFFSGPLVVLSFLISAPLIFGWLVKQFFQCGAAIWQHHWRRAAKRLTFVVLGPPLVFVAVISGDYLHLAALYPYYWAKIAQTTDRPVRFPWGDRAVSVLDGLQFRTLAYDDTGQTAAMLPRVDEGICYMNYRLIGNFFIEDSVSIQNLRFCGYSAP